MKTWIFVSMIIALAMVTIPTAGLAAVEIEQRVYFYAMDVTRGVATRTFVIGDFGPSESLRSPKAMVAASSKAELAIRTAKPSSSPMAAPSGGLVPPILFQLASATVPVEAEAVIIPRLQKKVAQSTPLQVTGYTCDLGPQKANDDLALHRARAVADLLTPYGYAVPVVTGKGKQDYVSTDPAKRHLNRRVEISIAPRPTRSEQ